MDTQQELRRTFVVPIGPQHPALKEPGHFEITVDGEIVTSATVRLGYVHRGIEKGVEGQNWAQAMYMLERICGICSHVHATAYALGVEALAGVQVPPRAQAIRVLVAELERVHSHLLWLGVAAHEGGFDTLFMYSWRDREVIMDVLEGLTGNRVNYSCNVLGGVKFDVDEAQAGAIRRAIDLLEPRTHHYLKVVTTDETMIGRTRNVGRMTADESDRLGAVGPTARASGVARDIRVDAPYAGYPDFPVRAVTATAGDLEAKFIVRLQELFESYRVIREILDKLPPGDLTVRVKPKVPAGETISRVEAPRGELFYFLRSTGGANPDRVKVRTPSLCNWGSVLATAPGHKLADVPMLIAGIDPCFSCNDRLVTIRRRRDEETWTWARLRQYGIEYYR
jgi:ech hydrogenase subunit E